MAKKAKFELNRSGVRDLLRSDEMLNVCKEYADRATASLGDGYESSTHRGKNRVNAEVTAATFKAKKENLKNNTILKALFG